MLPSQPDPRILILSLYNGWMGSRASNFSSFFFFEPFSENIGKKILFRPTTSNRNGFQILILQTSTHVKSNKNFDKFKELFDSMDVFRDIYI